MEITGVVQQKGGVGKTGLAAGTAGALAERGRRVLVGDTDPQGHLTVSALKLTRVAQDAPSLASALAGEEVGPTRELVVRHSSTPTGGVVDVLPSSLRMFTAARDLDKRPDRERQLGRLLEEVAADYDHCVLDGPPALDILTDNILASARRVVIPVQPDDSSIEALRILFAQIRALERALRRDPITVLGTVASNFRRPLSLIDQSVMTSLEAMREQGIPLLGQLPLAAVVKECWRAGVPTPLHARGAASNAASTYRAVADAIDQDAGFVIDQEVTA